MWSSLQAKKMSRSSSFLLFCHYAQRILFIHQMLMPYCLLTLQALRTEHSAHPCFHRLSQQAICHLSLLTTVLHNLHFCSSFNSFIIPMPSALLLSQATGPARDHRSQVRRSASDMAVSDPEGIGFSRIHHNESSVFCP